MNHQVITPDNNDSTPEWAEDAIRLSGLFSQVIHRTIVQRLLAADEVAVAWELTPQQLKMLRYVWLHDSVLVGELARGLRLSNASTTNLIKRLVEKHALERVVKPPDRRQAKIVITELGRSMVERLDGKRNAIILSVLKDMQSDDRANLLEGMRGFMTCALNSDVCRPAEVCQACGHRASKLTCPIADVVPDFHCK